MKKFNKKGFTLVEMLVVIAIIAVLVSIIIPTVTSSTGKAKAAANAANLRSLQAEYAISALNNNGTGTVDTTKAKFQDFDEATARATCPNDCEHSGTAVEVTGSYAKFAGLCVDCWASNAQ